MEMTKKQQKELIEQSNALTLAVDNFRFNGKANNRFELMCVLSVSLKTFIDKIKTGANDGRQ